MTQHTLHITAASTVTAIAIRTRMVAQLRALFSNDRADQESVERENGTNEVLVHFRSVADAVHFKLWHG